MDRNSIPDDPARTAGPGELDSEQPERDLLDEEPFKEDWE